MPVTAPLVVAALVASLSSSAMGFSERELADRYCAGMQTQIRMPDGTWADCLSDSHIIEVEFSAKWHEAIGQSLHYQLWTDDPPWGEAGAGKPREAGIILLCVMSEDTCTDHFVRLYRVIEHYELPITIWDCNPRTDATLGDCQAIPPPGS